MDLHYYMCVMRAMGWVAVMLVKACESLCFIPVSIAGTPLLNAPSTWPSYFENFGHIANSTYLLESACNPGDDHCLPAGNAPGQPGSPW